MDNNVKVKKNRRTLRSGSYTAAVCAILAAILVFANLIMSVLPTNYVKLDLSSNGIYSVGDTTRQVLDGINETVSIYHICEEGSENSTLANFLERYASINSNIKVEAVDPGVNPTFTKQYTDDEVYNNSLIVVGSKRNTVVYETDMYKYYVEGQYMSYSDYYNYSYYIQMYYGTAPEAQEFFFGEQEITSAIDYVTTESIPVMYYTSKHGETAINETYTTSIKNENIELKELDLIASGKIPEDAEAIIINAPTQDFTTDEVALIKTYMTGGGNVVLMTNYLTDMNKNLPNMAALCKELGLTSVDGMLMEEDSNYYSQAPYLTLPKLNETCAPAQLMKSTNVYVYMPFCHGITIAENAPYVTAPILTTSEKTYIKPTGAQVGTKEDTDPAGQFHTGVHVTLVASDVQTTVTDAGSFVWYSSNEIINPQYINVGNGDLFTSTLNTMCDKKSSISIIGKSLDVGFLTVDETESRMWQIVIIAVVPIAVIASGLAVWYKRRHR